MHDSDRFQLLHGPYQSPPVGVGDVLICEVRGALQVRCFSDGLISWPRAEIGRNRPYILCSDLVRALRVESHLSIQHWWSVSAATVSRWRAALGVEEFNEGTLQLFRAWTPEKITKERLRLAVHNAHSPAARAKVARTWTERGSHPHCKPWLPQEEALLGTMPDAALARQLGLAPHTVAVRRRGRGIAAFHQKLWQQRSETLVQQTPEKLRARREELGLTQEQVAQRAGTTPDYYSRLERGLHRVRPQTLARLAQALQCCPGELID